MELDLPSEVWQEVFSYLDLPDLASCRAVCKRWWHVVNYDPLWKRLCDQRSILEEFVHLEGNGLVEDPDCQKLTTCKWATICQKYYERVMPNWEGLDCVTVGCPLSTECVVIRAPYMLRTFDPYNVVEILRLNNGKFVPFERIHIPDDGVNGCYSPVMTADDIFVVSKNAFSIIFKLVQGRFRFEKAIGFTSQGFEFCCVEDDLVGFVGMTEHSQVFFSCHFASNGIMWLFEEISGVLYVWNYDNCELLSTLSMAVASSGISTYSVDNHIYCVFLDQCSAYSLTGKILWLHHPHLTSLSSFCYNKFGCGFIENCDGNSKAVHIDVLTGKVTALNVRNPQAIALNQMTPTAYCFCINDNFGSIVCTSLKTGKSLWVSVMSSVISNSISNTFIRMQIVLRKYIVMYGIDANSNRLICSGCLSIFSETDGKCIANRYFNPSKVIYFGDHFIVTRGRLPRGGMRYSFDIYSFL